MPKLSRLERVPLREYWPHEALDFTAWLAAEEGIALLGEAVSLSLEVAGQEEAVGPFRADLLCRDVATERWVLVENQLAGTDHTHLGQIITYAAGLDAATVIWVAEKFTDEHRAALAWLNRISGEGFEFYGLEIELWRIGDSDFAPKFNVVVQPNEWVKAGSIVKETTRRGGYTDDEQLILAFLSELKTKVRESGSALRPMRGQRNGLLRYGSHLVAADLGSWCPPNRNEQNVHVVFRGPSRHQQIRFVELHKAEIDASIGTPTALRRSLARQEEIYIPREFDLRRNDLWPEYISWHIEMLERMENAFRPYILELAEPEPQQIFD